MEMQSPKQPLDIQENGVQLYDQGLDDSARYLVVADEHHEHYRVTFYSSTEGTVSVGVSAEWSDLHPGQLANFTHDILANCGPDDTLSITDEGLLTISARHRAASTVDFRSGFTLQLPVNFVPLIRKAIRLARARALLATGAISDERFRELEAAGDSPRSNC